jgi:dTDP-4-dehydrorhamnose 3,5-epimerase
LNFFKQEIPDIVLIKPTILEDERGYFIETFRQDLFNKALDLKVNFIQDNESKSIKGVLRGLHYQIEPYAQAKLLRVIKGCILDVVVDIRKSSKTFGKHLSFKLSDENKYQLYVPRGFAHGFVVLSEDATFSYKVDNFYAPEFDRGIAFDDKDLAIDWKLPINDLHLSTKDKSNPALLKAKELFK